MFLSRTHLSGISSTWIVDRGSTIQQTRGSNLYGVQSWSQNSSRWWLIRRMHAVERSGMSEHLVLDKNWKKRKETVITRWQRNPYYWFYSHKIKACRRAISSIIQVSDVVTWAVRMKGCIHYLWRYWASCEDAYSPQLTHARGGHRYLSRLFNLCWVLFRHSLPSQISHLQDLKSVMAISERYKSLNCCRSQNFLFERPIFDILLCCHVRLQIISNVNKVDIISSS